MNPQQRTVARLASLADRPRNGWYRVIGNDAGGPTRIDIYDEIGGSWLFGGVSAQDFAAELAGIAGAVEVHINSPGGDVFDGIAIYNALAQRPGDVTTVVDGLAASAASFIAQAGKRRLVAPGAMMMIHEASGVCMGPASDMRQLADLLDKVSANIASLYGAHSGQAGGWREAMQAETWYTADEAVEAGLADALLERPDPAALAAAATFDLSMFAPPAWVAAAAPDPGQPAAPDPGDLALLHIANAAVDETSWDGPAAMSAASKADDPAAALNAICAGKRAGDPATQAAHALPHHKHQGDPPNRAGVSAALGRVGATEGLTNEAAARAHLQAHRAAIGSGAEDHADPVFTVDTAAISAALQEVFE